MCGIILERIYLPHHYLKNPFFFSHLASSSFPSSMATRHIMLYYFMFKKLKKNPNTMCHFMYSKGSL